MTERLIKTEGCYVGIFDLASEANSPGRFDAFLRQAGDDAKAAGEDWKHIYYFNQKWVDAAVRGEVLSWIVVFDGVFKVAVDLIPPGPPLAPTGQQVRSLLAGEVYRLNCPSGAVTIDSLSHLGRRGLTPMLTVEPGTYLITLTRDSEQEGKHELLESLSDYALSAGPDWRICMQRK
jgi:hypothetical protein